MSLEFTKMHGLGNDFVVIDARERPFAAEPRAVRALADRRRGVGFDQLVVLEPAGDADLGVSFYNADGGRAGACGNGVRCAAAYFMAFDGGDAALVRTDAGLAAASRDAGRIVVDMGPPRLDWREIPLARATPTDALDAEIAAELIGRRDLELLAPPAACSMGNPHLVLFVAETSGLDVEGIGAALAADPLFPEGANVGFARPLSAHAIELRVRERGVGVTLACGTGACAAVVAARRAGLLEPGSARVRLDGGELDVDWRDRVYLTGPAAFAFTGEVDLDALLEATP